MMKCISVIFVIAGSTICGANAARADYEVHLRGLFNLAECKCALLQVDHLLTNANRPPTIFTMTRLVKAGEQFEDPTIKGAHVNFEVVQISMDRQAGEHVRLRENGKDAAYGFEIEDAKALKLGFELQKARFQDVVDLYSQWKGRTVLLHPKLNWFPVSIRTEAQNEKEATAALERAFRDHGIAAVSDGDRFLLLVPISMEKSVKPQSKDLDPSSPQFGSTLLHGPLFSAIENYCRLLGREQLRGDPIPVAQVYLRTRMLSKAEMEYAYKTLLEWHGLKVVLIDDNAFKVVSRSTRDLDEK